MAVERAYKCDLCGEFASKDDVRRVLVRHVEDRPDGAAWMEVGPECHGRPIGDLLMKAVELGQEISPQFTHAGAGNGD